MKTYRVESVTIGGVEYPCRDGSDLVSGEVHGHAMPTCGTFTITSEITGADAIEACRLMCAVAGQTETWHQDTSAFIYGIARYIVANGGDAESARMFQETARDHWQLAQAKRAYRVFEEGQGT